MAEAAALGTRELSPCKGDGEKRRLRRGGSARLCHWQDKDEGDALGGGCGPEGSCDAVRNVEKEPLEGVGRLGWELGSQAARVRSQD